MVFKIKVHFKKHSSEFPGYGLDVAIVDQNKELSLSISLIFEGGELCGEDIPFHCSEYKEIIMFWSIGYIFCCGFNNQ